MFCFSESWPMIKRVLDLFCGAGGAAMGLHRAWPGAEIVGVDIKPQKRYPFTFALADALEHSVEGFDFIWASPPCQRYSRLQQFGFRNHPDLLPATRARLQRQSAPWVIENVYGAPLRFPAMLCGLEFNLAIYRHRYFEGSFQLLAPPPTADTIRRQCSSKKSLACMATVAACGKKEKAWVITAAHTRIGQGQWELIG